MKRPGLSLIFFFLCLILGAQEFTISSGANINYTLNFICESADGYSGTTITHHLAFGPYIDLTYARLGFDYNMIVAGTSINDSGVDTLEDFTLTFLDFYLMGKYPFNLGNFQIWPALGIRYLYCLEFEIPGSGTSYTSETDLSDFYIFAGVGFDFKVDNVVISPYLHFNLNLTPSTMENPPSGYKAYNFSFQLGTSIGYIFK